MSRTKHLNHNKGFLIGVILMSIIVIGVVFLFLSISFDNVKPHEDEDLGQYQLEFTADFIGTETQLIVNDSLLFEGKIVTDTMKITFRPYDDQYQLFVVDKSTGNTRSFNLFDRSCDVVIFKNSEGKTDILQKLAKCE